MTSPTGPSAPPAAPLTAGELRLLASTVAALPTAHPPPLQVVPRPLRPPEQPQGAESLLAALVRGEWEAVLGSPLVREAIALRRTTGPEGDADAELLAAAREAASCAVEGGEGGQALLCAAVAALNIFLAANFTGPVPECLPPPVELITAPPRDRTEPKDKADWAQRDRRASKLIEVDGEELAGKLAAPQYLLLARALLLDPLGLPSGPAELSDSLAPAAHGETLGVASLPCSSWLLWGFRTLATHQRVVSKRSATLRRQQGVLDPLLACTWGDLSFVEAQVAVAGGDGIAAEAPWLAPLLVGSCRMEQGALHDLFGDLSAAAVHLEAAGAAMAIELELTGVMGKRTVHQAEEKAQMVAKIRRSAVLEGVAELERLWAEEQPASEPKSEPKPGDKTSGWGESGEPEDVMSVPSLKVDGSALGAERLCSAEQILLLRAASHEKKREAGDAEIKMWRMAPFVEAVMGQSTSDPLVRSAALLMRSRHEFTRTRTKQRAFLRFTELVDGAIGTSADVSRLRGVHSVPMPSLPMLRKEYSEILIAIGLVGDAMRLLEELELWNSLITCYTMMDKKLQATELIRKRLEETPDDAPLLCSLGDCTGEEQAYHDAWEKSGQRSARAMRSLADCRHRKKDYSAAAEYWAKSLALNPLYSSGWFSMGHCYIMTEEDDSAIKAFTRCCQLEPDNGAAWNNVAALCLKQKKYKEAFSALSECTKHFRESWHSWDNYVQVALLTENFSSAVVGLQHMVRLRHGKNVPVEALEGVVAHLEGKRDEVDCDVQTSLLANRFGACLKTIAAAADSDAKFWSVYARYHSIMGQTTARRECLIKCTRALAGTPWSKDELKFVEMAEASVALAEAALQAVPSESAGRRELSQSRMQLRGIIKQAADCYEHHDTYSRMTSVLDRVVQEEARLKSEDQTEGATEPRIRTTGAGIRDC